MGHRCGLNSAGQVVTHYLEKAKNKGIKVEKSERLLGCLARKGFGTGSEWCWKIKTLGGLWETISKSLPERPKAVPTWPFEGTRGLIQVGIGEAVGCCCGRREFCEPLDECSSARLRSEALGQHRDCCRREPFEPKGLEALGQHHRDLHPRLPQLARLPRAEADAA